MKIRSLIVSIAVGLSAAAGVSPALAEVITFTAPVGFTGGSLSGFSFGGAWNNYGSDSWNAPFMNSSPSVHTMTYESGSFDFVAMSLSGNPWTGYGGGGSVSLDFTFKDISGAVIAADTFVLNQDDSFYTFTKSVANVHVIEAINYGGFPRLNSLTTAAAPVPEPETYALLMAGFGLMGAMSRRRKAKQA